MMQLQFQLTYSWRLAMAISPTFQPPMSTPVTHERAFSHDMRRFEIPHHLVRGRIA
jgi:hypothetical protein